MTTYERKIQHLMKYVSFKRMDREIDKILNNNDYFLFDRGDRLLLIKRDGKSSLWFSKLSNNLQLKIYNILNKLKREQDLRVFK